MADASGESEALTREGVGMEEPLDGLLGRPLPSSGVSAEEVEPITFTRRIKDGLRELHAPRLREASNSLLLWARSGSPFRTLLLTTVAIIILLASAGLLFFMIFFLVVTLNAIIIAFLISLAAAGGMLAIFFALLAAIYVGAMSTAGVVISTITIFAMIGGCIAAGWIGFFWIVYIAAVKTIDWIKKLLSINGRIVSASPTAQHM